MVPPVTVVPPSPPSLEVLPAVEEVPPSPPSKKLSSSSPSPEVTTHAVAMMAAVPINIVHCSTR
ncbi:MAG: hypothetical protein EOO73_05795 [Myxococcales bacterium]|nr:MAG: hypothetical protein EOO73_05795 [Myxococcales bacterium]